MLITKNHDILKLTNRVEVTVIARPNPDKPREPGVSCRGSLVLSTVSDLQEKPQQAQLSLLLFKPGQQPLTSILLQQGVTLLSCICNVTRQTCQQHETRLPSVFDHSLLIADPLPLPSYAVLPLLPSLIEY